MSFGDTENVLDNLEFSEESFIFFKKYVYIVLSCELFQFIKYEHCQQHSNKIL